MTQNKETQALRSEISLLKKDLANACNDLAELSSQNLSLKLKLDMAEKKAMVFFERLQRFELLCLKMMEKIISNGEKSA